MKINPRVLVPPSATVTMNTLALQKKQNGERVYNLSAGEPMLATPSAIIEAAIAAMNAGKTLYPPVAGILELRSAASSWMNKSYGSSYSAEQTLVTCGGKHGLLMLLQALLEEGNETLIIAPYWVSYPSMVRLYGGVPVIVNTKSVQSWKAEPEEIEKHISERTKILILNNAANPTGAVYSRGELGAILAMAKKHNLIIISDEVYSGLAYDNNEYVSAGSFLEFSGIVCVVQSCSKHFAMTGWRVGFVFAPDSVVKVLTTLQGQSTTGTSSISQWAAVAAFANADKIIPAVRFAMQERRDALINKCVQLFGNSFVRPSSALYAFIALSAFGVSEPDSELFCHRLLNEANIAAVPGKAFGQEGYVRLSFGAPITELEAALDALAAYAKK